MSKPVRGVSKPTPGLTKQARGVSKPARIVISLALPAVLVVLALTNPRFVLEGIVLPAATALWLVLRLFVLGIHQEVYWWAVVGISAVAAIGFLMKDADENATVRHAGQHAEQHSVTANSRDPGQRWRASIRLNAREPAQRDSFRRELAWLLASLYSSPHAGRAKYQVHAAMQEGRIPLPPNIHDFLFRSTRPRDPVPPFVPHPVRCVRTMARSALAAFRAGPPRRRVSAYLQAAEETLAFMETQLEMKDELDRDA